MQAFMDFFNEYRGRILELRELPGVHAVEIDYDDRWLALWAAWRIDPTRDFEADPPIHLHLVPGSDNVSFAGYWDPSPEVGVVCGGTPESWKEALDWSFGLPHWLWPSGQNPMVVRLVLEPGAPVPTFDHPDFTVVFTSRDRPRMLTTTAPHPQLVAGAAATGATSLRSGTMGGFVHDPTTGEQFGVTAAHVVDAGEDVNCDFGTGTATLFGPVVHRSTLSPWTGASGAQPDHVDAALVGLVASAAVSNGRTPIEEVRLALARAQASVEVPGGTRPLIAATLVVEPEVCFGSVLHRFDFLEQFFPVVGQPVPIVPGDSGGWILQRRFDLTVGSYLLGWVGVIVAADSWQILASPAEWVLDELRNYRPALEVL